MMISSETALMKNLIDLGIVELGIDNILTAQYITPDNNYIINLRRQPRLSFLSEDSDSMYYCIIEFCSSMGSPILEIKTNEIEISKMIDSFYSVIEYLRDSSVYHYFNPIDTNCIPRIFGLYIEDYNNGSVYDISQLPSLKFIFSVYDYINEQMIQRISIPMDNLNMFNFLEKLYYIFLIDVDTKERNLIE